MPDGTKNQLIEIAHEHARDRRMPARRSTSMTPEPRRDSTRRGLQTLVGCSSSGRLPSFELDDTRTPRSASRSIAIDGLKGGDKC